MHITDLVNQYQNSLNSGSKIAGGTKGVEQLVKTVSSMSKGQIFEGTVSAVKGNKVTLGLSSGQSITARIDKGINLNPGQSVFFQVKSNEGGIIQIKPVMADYGSNLTLLNALEAAGLPKTENNLNMVNNMMQQQMPIDAKSVNNMAHIIQANPGADVGTIVTMNKLDMPISPEMVRQFENYKASEGAILNTVQELSESIPQAMGDVRMSAESVAAFQKEFVSVLTEGMPLSEGMSLPVGNTSMSQSATNPTLLDEGAKQAIKSAIPQASDGIQGNQIVSEASVSEGQTPNQGIQSAAERIISAPITYEQSEFDTGTVGRALSPNMNQSLSLLISEHPQIQSEHPNLFDSNGNINPNASAPELAKAITDYMSQNPNLSKDNLMSFVNNKAYQGLLENLMENRWTIEPKELTQKGTIDRLYEKIDQEMERISQSATNHTKSDTNPISHAAGSIRDNLQFIQQVNQMYAYVQLPLKMQGQHTTGDLYVYTNKKQKKTDEDELSAFLHFDLDNLGSTDIAVKMKNKNVDTRFFMEDDISFQLIQNNIGKLEEKLNTLGYNCKIEVINDAKKVNLIEDVLKPDSKTAGNIQRYSFDVRA